MNQQTGKFLVILGVFLVLGGIIIYFFSDKLNWLGRLPGDIRIENERTKFYFPIVTMLIVSVLLNVVLYIIRKFIG